MSRITIICISLLSLQVISSGKIRAQGVSKAWATEYMNMYLQAKFD